MTKPAVVRYTGRWLMQGARRRKVYEAANTAGRAILGHRVRRGPAKGLKFLGGDTIGYVLGISEPLVQQALVSHLREGEVLYDIGAHAGFMTVLGCRLVGEAGEVHSFEPIGTNVLCLQRNLNLNGFTNAEIHRLAICDFDGVARMTSGPRDITARFDSGGEVEVRAAQLDSLRLTPPTVVKIDVEGAESAVLRGMTSILTKDRPVIVVEIHNGQEALVRDILAEVDYTDISLLDDGGMPHLLARCP